MTTQTLEQTRTVGDAGLPARPMLIGGAWCGAEAGETLVVENPARRQPICTVPRARAADVDRAVAAAAQAQPAWSRVPARERGRVLQRIADQLEVRQEELARTIAEETGNALRTQARGEAKFAVDTFRYFGGLASELRGTTLPLGPDVSTASSTAQSRLSRWLRFVTRRGFGRSWAASVSRLPPATLWWRLAGPGRTATNSTRPA